MALSESVGTFCAKDRFMAAGKEHCLDGLAEQFVIVDNQNASHGRFPHP